LIVKEKNILEILSGPVQFVLPIYQRHYSWEKEQCAQLWKDIVRMVKNPDVVGTNHFIGSIVNIQDKDNRSKFTLIDGQQRIATLTLILIVLRDYAREKTDSRIDAAEIKTKYLNKLILNGEDQDILTQLTDRNFDFNAAQNSNDDEDDISIPKLAENYKFFKQKFSLRNPELTPKQVYEALGKLKIVNITLGDDDNPQVIFESLNSSGKDLSKSDLIRNFMLMGLKPQVMTSIYNNCWSKMEKLFNNNPILMDNFFKDFLTLQSTHIPAEDQIYEKFKSWFYITRRTSKISDLCNDIYQKAKDYANIKFAQHANPRLQAIYAEIKELKMEVSYPFLLKIHADFRQNLLNEDDLIKIMLMCISYVVRRDICGLSSASLNQTFAVLKRSIDPNNYAPSVKSAFSAMRDLQRFPDDKEFSEAFMSCKLFKKSRRYYILEMLENFNSQNNIHAKNFTVDNVMPEKLSDEWQQELGKSCSRIHEKYLYTIGNLTLAEFSPDNSGKIFTEKKTMPNGFNHSRLFLNSFIQKQKTWNEAAMLQRAKDLTARALKLWSKDGGERTQQERRDIQLSVEDIFNTLDKRIKKLAENINTEDFTETFKKYGKVIDYPARRYKINGTGFAAVVKQQTQAKIYIYNVRSQDIADPLGICGKDSLHKIRLKAKSTDSNIDDAMEIIKQAFEKVR